MPDLGIPRNRASKFSVPKGRMATGIPGKRLTMSPTVPSPPAATIQTRLSFAPEHCNLCSSRWRRKYSRGTRSWVRSLSIRSSNNERLEPDPDFGFLWIATHGRFILATGLSVLGSSKWSECRADREESIPAAGFLEHVNRTVEPLECHSCNHHQPLRFHRDGSRTAAAGIEKSDRSAFYGQRAMRSLVI